jgi:hypothetical protein
MFKTCNILDRAGVRRFQRVRPKPGPTIFDGPAPIVEGIVSVPRCQGQPRETWDNSWACQVLRNPTKKVPY